MRIHRLRDKLILSSLVTAVSFALLIGTIQVTELQANLRSEAASEQLAAQDVAGAYAEYFGRLLKIERCIKATVSERHLGQTEAQSYLQSIRQVIPPNADAVVMDARGSVMASDRPDFAEPNASRIRALCRGSRRVGWSLTDLPYTDSHTPIAALNMEAKGPDGKTQEIVSVLMDEKCLQEIPDTLTSHLHDKSVIVIDSKGCVVCGYRMPGLSIGSRLASDPIIRRSLSRKPTILQSLSLSNTPAFYGVARQIPETGWSVLLLTPGTETTNAVRRQMFMLLVPILLFSGLTVGMALHFANRLTGTIVGLSDAASAFARGNAGVRANVHTGDELEYLASNFNGMADALQKHTEQLTAVVKEEHRQAQMATTLYSVAQGIIVNVRLESTLEIIAQALGSICNARRSAIFLPRANSFAMVAGWGLRRPEESLGMKISFSDMNRAALRSLYPGVPICVPDACSDARVPKELADRFGLKGFLAIPLLRRTNLVGVAILDNPDEQPNFDSDSINAARGLATLAAIAIENVERHERSANVADVLQRSMLPDIPEQVGSFSFASKYFAALETSMLGGDFYDFIPLPDGRIGLVIADVSGKGLEAAVFTAMGKYTLRAFLSEDPSPGRALSRVNDALNKLENEWGFVTLFYGVLDPDSGRLVYSSAGHPPPLLISNDGGWSCLPCTETRPPLGIFAGIRYVDSEYTISEGEVLACYTDGAIEARQDGERFDMDCLAGVLVEHRERAPIEIADVVYSAVGGFSHGRIQDDIALLIIKRSHV